jgi:hypothetical protein
MRDLRMDWGDACSIGRNGEQYFLINFTGKPIRFLRVDNAKEFTYPAMVNLCNANNIILQVVVSYNHLMQARVEGAIGICKQHTRVALAVTNAPARFWPVVLTDFRHKRKFLWSSEGAKGKVSTAHERLGPAFEGTFRTGMYLHSDSATPSVWMFDMISRTAMMVSDFKTYPAQFPMRVPTCLVSASFTHKDVQAMHNEDAIDDADLAAQSAPFDSLKGTILASTCTSYSACAASGST